MAALRRLCPAGSRSIAETSISPHVYPVALGRSGDAYDVVRDASVAAADGVDRAETGEDDGELQDGGHSKRRRLAGGDPESCPLPPHP